MFRTGSTQGMPLERTPFKAPLPCYGLELDMAQAQCRKCPHQDGCRQLMSNRTGRVTLDKLEWRLVPKHFGVELEVLASDDPDRHRINRVYQECYPIIFKRRAPDTTGRFDASIEKNASEAGCSIRVYILSNMVGWTRRNEIAGDHDPEARMLDFSARRLTEKNAVERAKTYSSMCRRSFGTFSPSALETLVGDEIVQHEYDSRMFNSEVIAGSFVIGHKIRHHGSGFEQLFRSKETSLDEIWLAIEPEYMQRVLEWRKEQTRPSIQRHRQSVMMAHGSMKKNKEYVLAAFEARQKVMHRAVETVLGHYGYRPEDFEMEAAPVTNAMRFWVLLGRAVCHMECVSYVQGRPSYFDRH